MVDVIYPQWYEHDLYDINSFSTVRRLINDLNGYVNIRYSTILRRSKRRFVSRAMVSR